MSEQQSLALIEGAAPRNEIEAAPAILAKESAP